MAGRSGSIQLLGLSCGAAFLGSLSPLSPCFSSAQWFSRCKALCLSFLPPWMEGLSSPSPTIHSLL